MKKIAHNKYVLMSVKIVFTVVALIVALIKIPLVPALPFLTLDFSDAPVLIATILYGYWAGIFILFSSSLIRMIMFSSIGLVGFIIRSTSIFLIFSVYFLKKTNLSIVFRIFVFSLGLLACICIKLPLNYIFWVYVFRMPKNFILDLMMPWIIPFNVFKIIANCALALTMAKPCNKLIRKFT